MNEWYYSSGGKQNGPVSFEQLVEIARSAGLDPVKDLVWNSNMKDWLPSGQVPGIFGAPAPTADPNNPYAAPESTWTGDLSRPTPAGEALPEIVPIALARVSLRALNQVRKLSEVDSTG